LLVKPPSKIDDPTNLLTPMKKVFLLLLMLFSPKIVAQSSRDALAPKSKPEDALTKRQFVPPLSKKIFYFIKMVWGFQ
jgi:hypothetical protein